MNSEQEQFESVRRILVIKRYEQPPPGYFNRFSGEVITRIRVERTGSASANTPLERMFAEAPFIARLWQAVESKPIFAGVFGTAVCGLLVCGIFYSDHPSASEPVAILPSAASDSDPTALAATQSTPNSPLLAQPAAINSLNAAPGSTLPSGSLFQELNRSRTLDPLRASLTAVPSN
jgi:hypothetical protein